MKKQSLQSQTARRFYICLVFLPCLMFHGTVIAGPISIGDFSGSQIITTFEGLGLPLANAGPLIIDGNTFTTDDGNIRYFSSNLLCFDGGCIGNNTDFGYIDVVFGSLVTRAGAFFGLDGSRLDPPRDSDRGFTDFYDASNTLLGSVAVGPGITFAGWEESSGIQRLRYRGRTENQLVSLMDDLHFEEGPLPTPATLALMSLGLAVLGWSRRQKSIT